MDDDRESAYRALVARANYFAPDRPDIAVSVKELGRCTSNQVKCDWDRLKRLARYLKGRLRIVKQFRWQ